MQAEELISILINLSKIDDNFNEFEFSYILNVGRHIGVPDHIVESLLKDPYITSIEIPDKEEERMTILYYMLFLMKIDHKINDKEKDMIQHYGFKLGFSRSMLEDFISLMERHKETRVPTDEMISIIRRYQN